MIYSAAAEEFVVAATKMHIIGNAFALIGEDVIAETEKHIALDGPGISHDFPAGAGGVDGESGRENNERSLVDDLVHPGSLQQDRAVVAAADLAVAIIEDAVVPVRLFPDAAIAADLTRVDDVNFWLALTAVSPPNRAPLLPTNSFELPVPAV